MTPSATPEAAPSPGILDEVGDDLAVKTHIVHAALELGVIPAVAAGHHEAEAIARATDASSAGMRVLLDALCVLGLLEWSDGRYELTPTAAAYLDPASPAYCAEMYLTDLRGWDHFAETIRTGQVPTDYASPAEADRVWASYAAQKLCSWPNEVPTYRQRWEGLGVTPSTLPGVRALDVGCGSALATLVLALNDPRATVMGLDRAPVVAVAGRLAETLGVASRASFVTGDATTLAELDGPYDLVFFGHVFHFLAPEEIGAALGEARRLLAPAGRVVILDLFATPGAFDDTDQYLVGAWLFNVAPRGRFYSFEEFVTFLQEAGFGRARRLEGTPWLQAEVAG